MEKCLKTTLIDYMIQSNQASSEKEADKLVRTRDFSYEKNLIKAGLCSLAESAGVTVGSLCIEEAKAISSLSFVSNKQIVEALNCIHEQWIKENLTPKLWVANYFEKNTIKYRRMEFLTFGEVSKDLVFINRYLEAANRKVKLNSLDAEFKKWRKNRKKCDDKQEIHDFINDPNFEVSAMKEIFKLKNSLEVKLEFRNFPRKEQEKFIIMLDAVNHFLDSPEVGQITTKAICPEIADFLIDKMFYQWLG